MQRIVTSFALALLVGCGSGEDAGPVSPSPESLALLDAASATITYRYLDSSLPPPGHRSYTLLVTSDSSRVSVDEYGTILTEAMLPTDLEAVEEVLRRFSESDLPAVTEGCSGAPTTVLRVFDASDVELRGASVTRCEEPQEAAAAELATIVDPVLVPFDIETLVESTRP